VTRKIIAAAVAILGTAGLAAVLSLTVAEPAHGASENVATVQAEDWTGTTDAQGYLSIAFDAAFDQIVVSGAQPQSGPGVVASVTCAPTGPQTARCHVWTRLGDGTVQWDANTQVTLELAAFKH
jgi:hypothetical protein